MILPEYIALGDTEISHVTGGTDSVRMAEVRYYRGDLYERLKAQIAAQHKDIERLRDERILMARLAADEPQFYNPIRVADAKNLRDSILAEAAKAAQERAR